MRLSIALLLIASAGGCSLIHSVEPNPPRDMSGCMPSPSCGVVEDMWMTVDAGDAGMCTMMCPGDASPDLSPDLRPQCMDSSTCPVTSPICMGGRCNPCNVADMPSSVECASYHVSTTPPTPLCGPAGACVQCLSKDDCAQFNQTCNLMMGPMMNTCVPCSANADCTTGVCKTGGACASSGEVYYVDNRGAATITACKTAHPTANGTSWTTAFCDITDATGSPSPRPYVLVNGSSTSYSALTLNATLSAIGPMTIIGPGHNAATTAKITPATGPAVSLATSGSNATLTIDGLELIGAGGGSPAPGAQCQVITSGTPTLTISDSYIHASGDYGVNATSCALTLDANIISKNSGGGLSVNKGSVTASNNLIVGNGTNGPGVLLQGSVGGTWWFNTVADNLRTGTNAAAFNCSLATAAPAIQASIIWGNTKDGTGSSVGSGCSFTYVDIDDTTTPTGTGNFKMDPMLTSGTLPAASYRIPSNSPCKDKITSATGLIGGTLPNHDVDGNARPRSSTGGYDCGGSQAP